MVPLHGPVLGHLISCLETTPATSRLHLDTIRWGPRQSDQDLGSYRVTAVALNGTLASVFGVRASWVEAVRDLGGADA